jgi:arylsulfatase A-like enzyme
MGKQNLYDHSVHVPLIICAPGLGKGKRLDALCYIHDLYPTLCELVGLKVPDSVETKSLVPVLTGARPQHRSNLFFAYKNYQRAVRDQRYKLIEYSVQGKRHTRLFDLQTDPSELRDLSDNTDYTPHLHRLRDIMLRWKDNLGDTSSFWQEFQV